MMLRRLFSLTLVCVSLICNAHTNFSDRFDESTLRVDISVTAGNDGYSMSLDSIAVWPGWYGRRVNTERVQYPEVMQLYVVDTASGDTIYTDAKSPEAFSEYGEERPLHVSLFAPKPLRDCDLIMSIYYLAPGGREEACSERRHFTADQLKGMVNTRQQPRVPYATLRSAADPKRSINLALVAEGYTRDEMQKFLRRAEQLDSALFSEQGFRENAGLFNVVAVMLPSEESGITVPSTGEVHKSALEAHYDSFGTERLMTIDDTWKLWDALEGVPASQVLILANGEKYGGSGAFNEYAIASADNKHFIDIITHEFGHSFAWLADEYESGYVVTYTSDVEPLEPNITTLHDFSKKWQNLIDSGKAGLIEGGGYQEKGVWRGCENCLMRSLADKHFCAVCAQAIDRTIKYLTEE